MKDGLLLIFSVGKLPLSVRNNFSILRGCVCVTVLPMLIHAWLGVVDMNDIIELMLMLPLCFILTQCQNRKAHINLSTTPFHTSTFCFKCCHPITSICHSRVPTHSAIPSVLCNPHSKYFWNPCEWFGRAFPTSIDIGGFCRQRVRERESERASSEL